jgi:soluble lytic murein transglycosylase-like protein
MVKALVMAVLLVGMAEPAAAQTVDWRHAGGDIFGRPVLLEDTGAGEAEFGPPRIPDLRQPYLEAIRTAAETHGLDPKLLHALVITESAYRPGVCSSAGACGLTQLMPATALELSVNDRFDPIENLRGGAAYLARQLIRFQDLKLALAAYNAGPTRVARLGRIPSIPETQTYVSTVIDCYLALAAGRGPLRRIECAPREATP